MNDIYLKFANSQIGQHLFQALNLPQPIELTRSADIPLSAPSGKTLVGGTKGSFALQNILKAFTRDDNTVFLARSHDHDFCASPTAFKSSCDEIQLNSLSNQSFKHSVFDATGFKNAKDLNLLYHFYKQSIRQIKSNGRIVIVAQDPNQISDAERASIHSSLLGFVKSIAKEVGKKGVCCNLIYVEKGAQKHLQSALYYLMTPKSAYVTGQHLTLSNNTLRQNKINWAQPLLGKTAIVTGAAQGIGYETAKILARDGATVICLDIPANESETKKLASSINGHSLSIDLGEPDAANKIMETVGAQLGVIDIIVHNAGITRDKTIGNMPEHFWNQVVDINLNKVIQINRTLLEKKAFNARARIVCISSISGIAGNFGQSNYACSKAGIAGYVESMSKSTELDQQSGITINAIAPGFIETKMTQKIPLMTREVGRRMNSLSQGGLPLDIAEGISFFCHPASQALNGNVIRICGQSLLGR